MSLQATLSVLEIVLLVAVLAFFVIRLTTLLRGVVVVLTNISGGVQAITKHVALIGPVGSGINSNLGAAVADLERAAVIAERLGA